MPSGVMTDRLPSVSLARHGETAWSLSGRNLAPRLARRSFVRVFTSPLQRAAKTSELAGFAGVAQPDPDLVEWDYGDYEGRRTADIHKERPGWMLFRDGCPNGESPAQIGARVDRVIARLRAIDGDVLLFSSGHFLRTLAARWLGLEPRAGQYFALSTASLSTLGYEHTRSEPVIKLWNETR
jgi:broad specificity phosphatase PhoE